MLRDIIHYGGSLQVKDNIVYRYDSSRNKHLSVYRTLFGFGINNRNISHSRIMTAGNILSSTSGYPISKMSTIICISAKVGSNTTCSFSVLKNGVDVGSLMLVDETINSDNNFDVNINKNDYIQMLANPIVGVIDFPEVILEISERFLI